MEDQLLSQIALSFVPNIGPVQARILVDYFGNASAIFRAKKQVLSSLEGIGEIRAGSIKDFKGFKKAADEIDFIRKYRITPLFLTDKNYPKRLLNCYDPPTILYYKGNADLNTARIIGVIGTRGNTDYGKQQTEKFIRELESSNLVIVSGLAFGIDAIAHKAALKNNMSTVGVLAHGLDSIYPSQHAALAKEMLQQGGLLTEFTSHTKADRHHFPTRNRIVAGMCDAVVVIETGVKGGSMITSELANGYNRDVFALPGRTTDTRSSGCNYLIKNNKAMLLTHAQDLMETMGWEEKKKTPVKKQTSLFIQLSEEEKIILSILGEKETTGIDELYLKSNLSGSTVAAAILNLELQAVIASLPGKMYRIL